MLNFKEDYIAVNYHYVQNPSAQWQGIYPCSVDDFEKQVKFLSENYKIVSVGEIYQAVKQGQKGKFCAITFDDGLRDQYNNAVPILRQYHVTATFFIIASVLEGYLPTTHKIHTLLSKISTKFLVDMFNSFLVEFHPDLENQYFIPKNRRLTERRKHESLVSANLKETFIILPEDIKNQFLNNCFEKFKLDEEKISQQFFMNNSEIKHLKNQQMIIGSHSYKHYALDTVNDDTLSKDIKLANRIFKKLLDETPIIFSYPHGRSHDQVVKVLIKEGFKYAVTIENRGLRFDDHPMLIPRYDANDIRDFLDLDSKRLRST